ncbi:MAG: GTP-binding protein [Actinophytocola sp.]|nr:GTP-binding protein [Actinophytocola sp.]
MEGTSSSPAVPVVIVAGFLGSGKTTLLNHLLRNDDGIRIGVIVNDFGSVNIDAMAVAGQVDAMVSLDNGCLCCAVDTAGMDRLLDRLTQPGTSIDVIVIEASGIAEPRDLLRLILASENPNITPGGLIEVIDAAEFEASRARHPELEQHVKAADLIVLNKIDRVDDATRARMLDELARLGGAPVLPSSHGRIDPRLLFDRPERREPEGPQQLSLADLLHDDHEHCDDHMHAEYQSVEFSTERPLHPRQFMAFLHDRPAGVYRMKGFTYFGVAGHTQKFSLQIVGGFVEVRRSQWSRGEPRRTQLVLIGVGIDADELHRRLDDCIADDVEQLDEQSMLPVLRYVDP